MKGLVFAIACVLFSLPAFAGNPAAGDPIIRTEQVETEAFTLLLANLEKEKAFISIRELDGTFVYSKMVKNHNGFTGKYDLSQVDAGRYVLTVSHKGKAYAAVIYVNEEGVMLSGLSER